MLRDSDLVVQFMSTLAAVIISNLILLILSIQVCKFFDSQRNLSVSLLYESSLHEKYELNHFNYILGYPNSYNKAATCKYTFPKFSSDVCRIRLDFVDATLANPSTTGEEFSRKLFRTFRVGKVDH